jgi:hypothetical protein
MFERYLHLHPAIQEMNSKDLSMPTCLDDESLIVLKSFCKLLKPFEIATSVLSKEQSNSISEALTIILEIGQNIKKFKDNNINNNLMTKKFEKYWKSILDHVLIAHVLDPRYKLEHLKATLIEVGGYNESDAEIFVNDIRKKIISCGMKYSNTSPSNYVEIDNNDNPMSEFLFPIRRTKRRKRIDTTEYELELYENGQLGNLDNDNEIRENNGIKLWESLSPRFPILSKMARDFLSIKPSSTSSERAFSRAGFTITNDRASICEKTVSCTILMHSWLMESQNEFSPLNSIP